MKVIQKSNAERDVTMQNSSRTSVCQNKDVNILKIFPDNTRNDPKTNFLPHKREKINKNKSSKGCTALHCHPAIPKVQQCDVEFLFHQGALLGGAVNYTEKSKEGNTKIHKTAKRPPGQDFVFIFIYFFSISREFYFYLYFFTNYRFFRAISPIFLSLFYSENTSLRNYP